MLEEWIFFKFKKYFKEEYEHKFDKDVNLEGEFSFLDIIKKSV